MNSGTIQTAADIARIESALRYIDATDRDTWVTVGMAINFIFPTQTGFEVWDRWSRTAENYQARAAAYTWKSFKPNGGITIATLFDMARHNGWSDYNVQPSVQMKAPVRDARTDEHRRTAEVATELWNAAAAIDEAGNPYLNRKCVYQTETLKEIDAATVAQILGYMPKGSKGKLTGRLLAVPVSQGADISNVQLIDVDGGKAFLSGYGTLTGGFWQTGLIDGNAETLLIGEGIATVLTAQQSLGHGVGICSFGLST